MNPATKARIEALARWLVDTGDLTPAGRRQLQKVLDDEVQDA